MIFFSLLQSYPTQETLRVTGKTLIKLISRNYVFTEFLPQKN